MKLVLKLDLQDVKAKQKAMKTVSTFTGIGSISMDMKGKKLTVIGTVDPISVVSKLRKHWQADIISVGPAKEPEKKEEPKKEGPKKEEPKKEEQKEEPKKEEAKKEEEKKEEPKKEEEKKEEPKKEEAKAEEPKKEEEKKPDPVLELVKLYRAYNPQMTTYYYAPSMEENPNACVIL
ncbi:heavy metal-associated isoprenylated plant protein 39 isoform X2 [Malania oleifera]|uniref:heavy metal-associated isoprenylated plant protein 39 isoform X2 n=1 Tax=Malania oleifera TaxID=397392 RepID=UPI0025AE0A86|nr:heavy metal-associated isoprenylated plant protein 39 isoform X2 [Malania oleifera]